MSLLHVLVARSELTHRKRMADTYPIAEAMRNGTRYPKKSASVPLRGPVTMYETPEMAVTMPIAFANAWSTINIVLGIQYLRV